MSLAARSANRREEPDEVLMVRYAAGDTQAFDELFRRYEPRAYVFFLKRTNSAQRAEDLYQELFLRIHAARDRYEADRPFTPWFFQIARRLLIDDQRRVFRGREVPLAERDPASGSPGNEERLAGRERVEQVMAALSPDERYAVLSNRVEGIGYPEIGAQLGKSADAVKKMTSRAIGRLRSARDEGLPPESKPVATRS